jgi:hypothetical protein
MSFVVNKDLYTEGSLKSQCRVNTENTIHIRTSPHPHNLSRPDGIRTLAHWHIYTLAHWHIYTLAH